MSRSRYDAIREQAFEANMQLPALNLVLFTFGNVSAADRKMGVFAIKPSGVPYEKLSPDQMVVVDFGGKKVEGKLRYSSDTLTHAVLYRHWDIGGICHTHSMFATAWAQNCKDIPILGTTHADHLTVDVPCAAPMEDHRILGNYEEETGHQIMECMEEKMLSYLEVEMILVGSHGPFTWGNTAEKAVYNAAVLEQIAHMAFLTPFAERMKTSLIQKHYTRKHGKKAYYGQE
jgi:L-ribulose-5-phosphate 4-epimerase